MTFSLHSKNLYTFKMQNTCLPSAWTQYIGSEPSDTGFQDKKNEFPS